MQSIKKTNIYFFFTFERREFSQIKSTTQSLFFPNSGIWILVNVAFVDVHENPNYETPADRRSMLQDPF